MAPPPICQLLGKMLIGGFAAITAFNAVCEAEKNITEILGPLSDFGFLKSKAEEETESKANRSEEQQDPQVVEIMHGLLRFIVELQQGLESLQTHVDSKVENLDTMGALLSHMEARLSKLPDTLTDPNEAIDLMGQIGVCKNRIDEITADIMERKQVMKNLEELIDQCVAKSVAISRSD
jgi:DNA repair ATPase RecN